MSKPAKGSATINVRPPQEPVFIYTSVCCQAPASKTPCVMPKGKGIGGFGSRPEGEATLGSFRCTQCRKPAKVTRSLNPAAKAKSVNIIGR